MAASIGRRDPKTIGQEVPERWAEPVTCHGQFDPAQEYKTSYNADG